MARGKGPFSLKEWCGDSIGVNLMMFGVYVFIRKTLHSELLIDEQPNRCVMSELRTKIGDGTTFSVDGLFLPVREVVSNLHNLVVEHLHGFSAYIRT